MKQIILLLASIYFSVSMNAQTALNVKTKDGSNVQYVFSEKPKVTFNGNVISIATTKTTAEFQMADVADFTFSNATAIEAASISNPNTNGIQVYTISGTLIHSYKNENITTTFSTASLPAGTYIIENGANTYKIIKK